MELIDPSLKDEPQISDILRCIQIALLCVQGKWEDRPSMSDVLIMLKCESMTLPVPRPPENFSHLLPSASATSGSNTYSSAEGFTTEEEESLSYFSCCSSDVDDNDTSNCLKYSKI